MVPHLVRLLRSYESPQDARHYRREQQYHGVVELLRDIREDTVRGEEAKEAARAGKRERAPAG